MKKVRIFTDGACRGNPGPGGWAAILIYNQIEKEISGGSPDTTNNRMEVTAVLKGLELLKQPCSVTVYSDSKYVCDAIDKGWAKKWESNNWKRDRKNKALNSDLWEKLLRLLEKHEVKMFWVKGHAGNIYNERCDVMAVKEASKY